MHSRGSGFFDFSYTSLTAGNLLVSLLFFATPSKAQRICAFAISGLLLIDMIIILAVSRLRLEEGWIGIASVIWATVIAAWTVMTDRVVAWGKKEEEERLTGREENRRTLREWCSVFTSSLLMVVFILVVILLSATLILRSRDASLEAPGQKFFVDGNKYQIHLFCKGKATNGSSTLLIEGGENPVELGLVPFAEGALKNGTVTRYCYWDRPGIAWSDNAPSPLSAGMVADHLSEALVSAGEEGPWVVMGAGVGGIYSRVFAARQTDSIKGIFLVDALHEDLLSRIASPRRGLVLWGRGVLSPLGLDRLSGALFKGRTREDRVWGISAYQGGKFIKAKLQENLVAESLTKSEITTARQIQHPNTPVVVISSGIRCHDDYEWQEKQTDLAKITDKLVAWNIVKKAPHEVWTTFEGREIMEKQLAKLF
ncbi:MAG: hypothetical protein M1814_002025 [Vezdaea aestivalis]|nr:MAG: hypothetical protein M1814_002025 [Vezdaea aestivalis]